MFLDQAYFIQTSINTAMNYTNFATKKFTIIAHSIGCLQALLIEPEVNKNNQLLNVICLAPPLIDSPLKYLNDDLENVMKIIQSDTTVRKDSNVHYFFF